MNNNVIKNSVYNLTSRYSIKQTQSNFEELKKEIGEKDYFVY